MGIGEKSGILGDGTDSFEPMVEASVEWWVAEAKVLIYFCRKNMGGGGSGTLDCL